MLLLFNCSVMSNSLWSHGLQHPKLSCASPSSGVCPSSCSLHYLILWCPLLLLPTVYPSIRDFSNESSVRIRWPKYWSFGFGVIPSSEYSGLISFRIDWFDLLAVQGTFKRLLQHHYKKVLILRHSAFLIVQLSHPYMTSSPIQRTWTWESSGRWWRSGRPGVLQSMGLQRVQTRLGE